MSVPIRLGLFAAGLVAIFVGAFAAGDLVDPEVDGDGAAHAGGQPDSPGAAHGGHDVAGRGRAAGAAARIVVDGDRFDPGVRAPLRFRVVDRAGGTVDDFDVEHEREMHVIAVRRDLTGYQHVHPRRVAGGGWEVDVAFPEAGPHRVFADFASRGQAHTLGADVEVTGSYEPRPLPAPQLTATAGDGYRVALANRGSERRFTVSKDGRPVGDIEPYLGARGHLVALREGDLAFQHVHPQDAATEGREISFDVSLAKAGRYRLFLQFKHDGKVRTAAFTEAVDAGSSDHGASDHAH